MSNAKHQILAGIISAMLVTSLLCYVVIVLRMKAIADAEYGTLKSLEAYIINNREVVIDNALAQLATADGREVVVPITAIISFFGAEAGTTDIPLERLAGGIPVDRCGRPYRVALRQDAAGDVYIKVMSEIESEIAQISFIKIGKK